MNTYDVMPYADGWQVKRRGDRMATAVRATQQSAVKTAERLARAHRPSVVVVWSSRGQVKREIRYGDVPPVTPQWWPKARRRGP